MVSQALPPCLQIQLTSLPSLVRLQVLPVKSGCLQSPAWFPVVQVLELDPAGLGTHKAELEN